MAFTSDLMAFGASPFLAGAVVGSVSNNLTATGSTQGTALALTASLNVVTTTAASTGVLLPPMQAGDDVLVTNLGASSLSVYPRTGGTIQGGSANAAFAVAAGKTARFIARDNSANSVALLSA